MTQNILITGASSGIGLSTATYFKKQGYTVIGTSRSANFGEQRDGIHFVPLDVCDDESVSKAVFYILEHFGTIDVLINNAGIGMLGSVEDSLPEEMKEHFETNYYGPLRMIQAVLPAMRERGAGRIINISSLAGIFGLPYRGGYSAAKFAINGLTETLRMEVMQFGIQVSVLCPGDFKTNISSSRIEAKQAKESVYAAEFANVHRLLDEELNDSGDPILVAKTAHRIIKTQNQRPYYFAASGFQRFVVRLRFWLPSRFFQWLMMRNYNMLDRQKKR